MYVTHLVSLCAEVLCGGDGGEGNDDDGSNESWSWKKNPILAISPLLNSPVVYLPSRRTDGNGENKKRENRRPKEPLRKHAPTRGTGKCMYVVRAPPAATTTTTTRREQTTITVTTTAVAARTTPRCTTTSRWARTVQCAERTMAVWRPAAFLPAARPSPLLPHSPPPALHSIVFSLLSYSHAATLSRSSTWIATVYSEITRSFFLSPPPPLS